MPGEGIPPAAGRETRGVVSWASPFFRRVKKGDIGKMVDTHGKSTLLQTALFLCRITDGIVEQDFGAHFSSGGCNGATVLAALVAHIAGQVPAVA